MWSIDIEITVLMYCDQHEPTINVNCGDTARFHTNKVDTSIYEWCVVSQRINLVGFQWSLDTCLMTVIYAHIPVHIFRSPTPQAYGMYNYYYCIHFIHKSL